MKGYSKWLSWAKRWCAGLLISFLFIWCVGAVFINPISTARWNSEFQRYIYKENEKVRWREEGWGHTTFGQYGINQYYPTPLEENGEKILIWGDSHVENLQVSDGSKVHDVLNEIFKSKGVKTKVLNLGQSGNAFPHYYFQMQKYQKIIPRIQHHYIILSGLEDIEPAKIVRRSSSKRPFVKESRGTYVYQKVDANCGHPDQLKSFLKNCHMQFVKVLRDQILGNSSGSKLPIWKRLKWYACQEGEVVDAFQKAAGVEQGELWLAMLKSLKDEIEAPITIVYLPDSPRIEKNKINFVDEQEASIKIFAEKCRVVGFEFISLNDEFSNLYREKNSCHEDFLIVFLAQAM